MKTRSYDVIIVGAGPSGAECARVLGASGARVLLLDKKKPGWHKPCGGGVSEKVLRNFDVPLSLAFETAGVRVSDAKGRSVVAPIRFVDVRRDRFDEFLSSDAAARGVEVRLQASVQKLSRTAEGFEVETREETYRSSYLVGADGFSSTVRERLFSERIDADCAAIALEAWYEWDHGVRHLDFFLEAELLPLGYAYAFPRDERTIAIGIAGLEIERPREVLARLLALPRYKALTGGREQTAVHGARIPYRPLSKVREGRLLLCGDAAGLNTPLVFAGIPIALRSGNIAGKLLAESIRRGSDAPLDGYTVPALAAASWSFRACHAYWDHLVEHGAPPGLITFLAETCQSAREIPSLTVTWRMLKRMSAAIDPVRARRFGQRNVPAVSSSAHASLPTSP
ncbi:MAG: geranylgeranyl reductase family protein [Minicystis sp.]